MSIKTVNNPPRCRTCGRDLPWFRFGEASDICPDCRTHAVQNAPPSEEHPSPSAETTRLVVRQRSFPVTKTLVGINCAVFLLMTVSGVSPVDPAPKQLIQWGADWGPLALTAQPWRMLSSNYVHIGLFHIALNMWCLWNLGFLAEVIFDRWTYILAYTACGIAGSLASLWWHPLSVGAGASGAIFGLAGALIAALYLGKLPIPKEALKGTLKSLLTFAGYNLVFGAVGRFIDNSAHIGGLLMGLLIGAVMAPHLINPDERNRWRVLIFGAVMLLLFAGTQYVRKVNAPAIQQIWQNADRPHSTSGDQPAQTDQ
ncbi:MAG TPA: rhomboid family intramembrane serine protease [Terriglobales bacterium]|nr:rhomboid family intramembrane serine protease [Terriglobales bacterium]